MTDGQGTVRAVASMRRSGWRRRVVAYPLMLAAGYAAWCGVLFVRQDSMIFPRELARPRSGVVPRGVEQIWIDAADGVRVEGWFIRGAGRSVARPGAAVIYAHGNGELIDHVERFVRDYEAWGVSVLLPEYRGYGRSGGRPSERDIAADMERFYDWLAARPEVDGSRIVLHGKSLGGGVAAGLALRRKAAALILESTFTSVASFCRGYGVPEFLCRHPYRTDEALSRIECPVLILHGSGDTIIPVWHARRLHELARGSTYVEMESDHNEFPPDWDRYWEAIREFLSKAGVLEALGGG